MARGYYKDLSGERFGKLVVVSYLGSGTWKVKCDCGANKKVRTGTLNRGDTKSCGCLMWVKSYPKEMAARRFGNLVVTSFSRRINKHRMWNCKCDCGGVKEVSTGDLNSGHVKSCGCIGHGSSLPSGEASFNSLVSQYRRQAKNRNRSFRLSKKCFRELVQNNCYYCDLIPNNEFKKKGALGTFVYNGIDRIDNRYGYSVNNCVSCCKTCNWAKGTMNLTEFKSWIARIVVYNTTEPQKPVRKIEQ